MSSITDNIRSVTRRIQKATLTAGRADGSVRLLAVSKTRPAADVRQAAAEGQLAFGENYVQEALDKMQELTDLPELEWHFIGPIQSNKTRAIAGHFHWVHSVDRLKIARRLSEQRPSTLPPLNVCLQVNINQEDSKSGCLPDEVVVLATEVSKLPGLILRGLMAIPDPHQSEAQLRASFARLAALLAEMRQVPAVADTVDTLSMGMSADLELAIAEGATIVRVGTDLFGARN